MSWSWLRRLGLCLLLITIINSNRAGLYDNWLEFKSTVSGYVTTPRSLLKAIKNKVSPVAELVSSPATYLTKKATEFLINQLIYRLIPRFNAKNPYALSPAQVRIGTNLSSDELGAVDRRLDRARPALQRFLNINLLNGQMLRIGFCGSGGGYRAMLSTTGFLNGASKIGLLDAVTYMSALSGSTWALGSWLSLDLPISDFRAQLISKTQNTVGIVGKELLPPPGPAQMIKVFNNLERKYLFDQPITSVDLWGAMIANRLFEPQDKRQNVYLSQQQIQLIDGFYPIPIYTAVNPQEKLKYHWFEFTPYEIGSTDLKAFVPTWAFGRKFEKGATPATSTSEGKQYAPEQSLGYYLGIFGSAFTVNMDEVINMLRDAEDPSADDLEIKVSIVNELVDSLAGISDIRTARISPAKVFNHTYGIASSPVKNQELLTLVDAGLAFNLPTPPLLRPERQLDVIFIFDSSADIGTAGELRKAERHAKANNIPFPPIDYQQARTQTISFFSDEKKPKCPMIIYMPLIKDLSLPSTSSHPLLKDFDPKACVEKDYCSTFNFKYDPQEFETLTLLTEINMVDNADKIKEALLKVLRKKYNAL